MFSLTTVEENVDRLRIALDTTDELVLTQVFIALTSSSRSLTDFRFLSTT